MLSWFGNLSVNRKLGLGFALVLLFTLALAIIGWNGLSSMISRSDRMGDIAALHAATSQMQISRLEYMLTDGDENAMQKAQGDLEALQAKHQAIKQNFTVGANVRLLGEIGQAIQTGSMVTNYHDIGSGEPVLLLHGSGPGVSAWANWRLSIQSLKDDFRLLAPDLAGFGFRAFSQGGPARELDPALVIDADAFHPNDVTDFCHVFGSFDPEIGQLGNMHEPVSARENLDKRAEFLG